MLRILLWLQIMLEKSRFLEKKWYGSHVHKSGHPVLRGSSAFERGDLKSEGKGKLSIHFNGSDETVEVILRTFISVNQLNGETRSA